MNLITKLQQILEINRLEKRYTRRSHRDKSYTRSAIYVDGEYVFPPSLTTSSSSFTPSSSVSASASSSSPSSPSPLPVAKTSERSRGGRRRSFDVNGESAKMPGSGNGLVGGRDRGKRASVSVWVREVVGSAR